MMRSIVGALKSFALAIAETYISIVFYNVVVWVPPQLLAGPATGVNYPPYYILQVAVFQFPGIFRGMLDDSGPASAFKFWEAFAGPVVILAAAALAARSRKGWLRFPWVYLSLTASLCLMSLMIRLSVLERSGIINFLGLPGSVMGSRMFQSVVIGFIIVAVNYLIFRRLFRDTAHTWIARLGYFAGNVLLPAALVTLFMALGIAHSWGPFRRAGWVWDPMYFEGWLLVFLPIVMVGALATLLARRARDEQGN